MSLFIHCVSPGPDYIKQRFNDPIEIKEVTEEKKEKCSSGSPHFYRKGTTPTHSPAHSPEASPAPSPHTAKKKPPQVSSNLGRKPSRDETYSVGPNPPASVPRAASRTSSRQEAIPQKPPKKEEPTANSVSPGNGQVHSQYHSYHVMAEVTLPPEEPRDDLRVPQGPKQLGLPASKPILALPASKESMPEAKLRKQESLKPKSLVEMKKGSMEISSDVEEEEEMVSAVLGLHRCSSTQVPPGFLNLFYDASFICGLFLSIEAMTLPVTCIIM